MTPPRAVTFDYWQTLVSERRGVMRALQIDRWGATLAEVSQPRSADLLADAFAANWDVFEARWRANGGSWGAAESVDHVAASLEIDLDTGLRARLIDSYRVVGETAPLFPACR